MIVKNIIDEDFVNYKEPSMLIMFPRCTWKCGGEVCHNSGIAALPDIEISIEDIIWRWTNNKIANAIVCSGLEPFESYDELLKLVKELRKITSAPIIIYTGYTEDEISKCIEELSRIENIIIKFGRYMPNHQPHYDRVLGISLASDNQYARQIS